MGDSENGCGDGETVQITIQADDHGRFTYTPSTVPVKPGECVAWTSGKLGPFAISFMDHTPFLDVAFSSELDPVSGDFVTQPRKVRNHLGHHHYAVAVSVVTNAGGRAEMTTVLLDSGCPDIVVSG